MTKSIYYEFLMDNDVFVTYDYLVEDKLQDIIEYKYEQKFGKKYNELSWYLETGATKFVNEIEEEWFHNRIDTTKLYNMDFEFYEWLKNKYSDIAFNKCLLEYQN